MSGASWDCIGGGGCVGGVAGVGVGACVVVVPVGGFGLASEGGV